MGSLSRLNRRSPTTCDRAPPPTKMETFHCHICHETHKEEIKRVSTCACKLSYADVCAEGLMEKHLMSCRDSSCDCNHNRLPKWHTGCNSRLVFNWRRGYFSLERELKPLFGGFTIHWMYFRMAVTSVAAASMILFPLLCPDWEISLWWISVPATVLVLTSTIVFPLHETDIFRHGKNYVFWQCFLALVMCWGSMTEIWMLFQPRAPPYAGVVLGAIASIFQLYTALRDFRETKGLVILCKGTGW